MLYYLRKIFYFIFIFPFYWFWTIFFYFPYYYLWRIPRLYIDKKSRPYVRRFYIKPRRKFKHFCRTRVARPLDKIGGWCFIFFLFFLDFTILLIPHILVAIFKIRKPHRFVYRRFHRYKFRFIVFFFSKLARFPRIEGKFYFYWNRFRLYPETWWNFFFFYFAVFCINYRHFPLVIFVIILLEILLIVSILTLYWYLLIYRKFTNYIQAKIALIIYWGTFVGFVLSEIILVIDEAYPSETDFDQLWFTCDRNAFYVTQIIIYGFDIFDKYYLLYLDKIWLLYLLMSLMFVFFLHFYFFICELASPADSSINLRYHEDEYYWLDWQHDYYDEILGSKEKESIRVRKMRYMTEQFDAETARMSAFGEF